MEFVHWTISVVQTNASLLLQHSAQRSYTPYNQTTCTEQLPRCFKSKTPRESLEA